MRTEAKDRIAENQRAGKDDAGWKRVEEQRGRRTGLVEVGNTLFKTVFDIIHRVYIIAFGNYEKMFPIEASAEFVTSKRPW